MTFKIDKSMYDDDFIANIGATNLLCNIYDDLGVDRTGIRKRMDALFPTIFKAKRHSSIQQSLAAYGLLTKIN